MQKNMRKTRRVSRFFIEQPLSPTQTIKLPPHLVNYIVNVLRLKSGDDIILFNGLQKNQKGEYGATLSDVSKRSVSAVINGFIAKDLESPLRIHLFQGLSRSERMDFTIQKAVELGVDCISPLFTQRSNTGKWNSKQLDKKHQHWQGIANSACEQSGRTQQVVITPALKIEQLNDYCADLNLVLAPNGISRFSTLKQQSPARVNILIGPEGGLTEEELTWAIEHQYEKVQLGKRILRTETAGLTAISILQYLWGDMA